MKIRRSPVLSITLALCALAVAACSKGPANNSNGASTANNANASNTKSAASTNTTPAPLSTPTIAFMTFYEAAKRGDVEAVKRTLSKNSLEFLTAEARKKNQTLEAGITESLQIADIPKSTPEVRNEKINGDNATLEVKYDKTGKWEAYGFSKEGSDWKIKLGLE